MPTSEQRKQVEEDMARTSVFADSPAIQAAREKFRRGHKDLGVHQVVAPNRAILNADPKAGGNITHAGRTR